MKIRFTGRNKKVSKSEYRDAITFTEKHLFTPRMAENICVTFVFKSLPGLKGLTEVLGDELRRHREFAVYIRPSMSKEQQLRTLIHELVHVKQFAYDELNPNVTGSTIRWLGKPVDFGATDYWDLPWEIEANGREIGIYERYKFHLRCRERNLI